MKISPFHTPPPLRAERGVPVDVDAEDHDFDKLINRELKNEGRDKRDRLQARDGGDDGEHGDGAAGVSGAVLAFVVHPWQRPLGNPAGLSGLTQALSEEGVALRGRFQRTDASEDVVVTIVAHAEAFAADGVRVDDDDDDDLFDDVRASASAAGAAATGDAAPVVDVNKAVDAVVVAAARVDEAALEAAVDALHDPAARLNLELNTGAVIVDGLRVRVTTQGESARVVIEGKDAASAVSATRELEHRLAGQGISLESVRAPSLAPTTQSAAGGDAERHGGAVVDVDEDARVDDADGSFAAHTVA